MMGRRNPIHLFQKAKSGWTGMGGGGSRDTDEQTLCSLLCSNFRVNSHYFHTILCFFSLIFTSSIIFPSFSSCFFWRSLTKISFQNLFSRHSCQSSSPYIRPSPFVCSLSFSPLSLSSHCLVYALSRRLSCFLWPKKQSIGERPRGDGGVGTGITCVCTLLWLERTKNK